MFVGEVWVPKSFACFFRLVNRLFASFESCVPLPFLDISCLPLDLDLDLDLEVHLWSIPEEWVELKATFTIYTESKLAEYHSSPNHPPARNHLSE